MKASIIFHKESNLDIELAKDILDLLRAIPSISIELLEINESIDLKEKNSDIFIILADEKIADIYNIEKEKSFCIFSKLPFFSLHRECSCFYQDNIEYKLLKFIAEKFYNETSLKLFLNHNPNDSSSENLKVVYEKFISIKGLDSFIEIQSPCCTETIESSQNSLFISFENTSFSDALFNQYKASKIPVMIISKEKWRFPFDEEIQLLDSDSIEINMVTILKEAIKVSAPLNEINKNISILAQKNISEQRV